MLILLNKTEVLFRVDFNTGWGWGDPHYGYFDDKITPFNTFKAPGSHYYNIVQVTKSGSVVFTLQALISDLLIKSMAFGIKGIESYQVNFTAVLHSS